LAVALAKKRSLVSIDIVVERGKGLLTMFFSYFFWNAAHAIVDDGRFSRTGQAPGADIQEARVNLQCPK
jgi:hypothetical protein